MDHEHSLTFLRIAHGPETVNIYNSFHAPQPLSSSQHPEPIGFPPFSAHVSVYVHV